MELTFSRMHVYVCNVQLVEHNGAPEDISEQLEMILQDKLQVSSLAESAAGEPTNYEEEKEEEEEWSEEDRLRIQPCVDLINVQ